MCVCACLSCSPSQRRAGAGPAALTATSLLDGAHAELVNEIDISELKTVTKLGELISGRPITLPPSAEAVAKLGALEIHHRLPPSFTGRAACY